MLKIFRILPVLLVVSLCVYGQYSYIDHWVLVVNSDDEFQYWSSNRGTAGDDWRTIDFDDQLWDTGEGGIGYGDEDDSTVIDPCSSVFIRKSFTAVDTAAWVKTWLYIDYDDAFVAYLNGSEIARSAGLSDPFPGPLQLSATQHEAGEKEGFLIASSLLEQNLVSGKNILCIQVHNVTTTSSDLSSSVWLIAGISTPGSDYRHTPEWFTEPVDFTSSNLPLVIINTENNAPIVDEPKIGAYMGIIFNGDGQKNHISNTHNHYSGHVGIEIRGHSTSGFPKKPYNFETRDSLGENLNVSLFGWPEENDWVLRASYIDHTFIRNGLANHMSRQNGYWASHTRLVEVVLNGEYQGIYILMEKIKRDKGRLDIADLYPDEITEPDITGGYIWEITGFETNFGDRRNLKYPKFEEAAPEQIAYITKYDNEFRNAMKSENFADSTTGYHAYINVESFINEIIVQEAMRNSDAYGWSGYFHKDKMGKINAGPVWDFDQSAGNSSYPDDGVVEGWMFSHPNTSNEPFFWKKLFTDPAFSYAVRHRWEYLRQGPYKTENLIAYIDSVASLLSEPQKREFSKWDVLGKFIWRETSGYQDRDSYYREVGNLKIFLTRRMEWMDNELAQYENPFPEIPETPETPENTSVASKHPVLNISVYPNPVSDRLTVRISQPGNSTFSISLYNNVGVLVQKHNNINAGAAIHGYTFLLDNRLEPGIYFYRIESASGQYYYGRFIKVE